MRQLFIILIAIWGFAQHVNSQNPSSTLQLEKQTNNTHPHACGMTPPDAATLKYLMKEVISKEEQRASNHSINTTSCIPVQIHIIRLDNGTNGFSPINVAKIFANLNNAFADQDLEFYAVDDINYIDNSDAYVYNKLAPDNDIESDFTSGNQVTNAVNLYLLSSITLEINGEPFQAGGYAYYPSSTLQSNTIVMKNTSALGAPNGTFAHEFGHYFGLFHTHHNTEFGNDDPDAERVVRSGPDSNCETNGDMLCDTDADPRYDASMFSFFNCTYTGNETDNLGVPYVPTTAINNIMSYYPDGCDGVFSSGQKTRMASGAITRQGYSAYNLNYVPSTVNAPSNLIITNNLPGLVELSWTDNANNELGYIIERSTISASTGFVPIVNGGVGENINYFSNFGLATNTPYWYRVRPVNGGCGNYSNVVSFGVPTDCESNISGLHF